MQRVDYDVVAAAYDQRYAYRHYEGTRALLRRFIGNRAGALDSDNRSLTSMRRALAFVIVTGIGILGCLPRVDDTTIRRFLPDSTDRFARAYIDSLRLGAADYVIGMLAAPLDTLSSVRDSLAVLRSAYPAGAVKTVDVAAVGRTWFTSGITRTEVAYQTHHMDGVALTELTILEEHGLRRIASARAYRLAAPLQTANALTLRGKGAAHYLVPLLATIVIAFSLSVAAMVVRTRHMPRRWWWAAVALIGTGKFAFNWTTGQVGSQLFAVQLLGVSAFRIGILGPWIVALSVPAGALLALERRRRFLRKRAVTDSSTGVTVPANASLPLSNEELKPTATPSSLVE